MSVVMVTSASGARAFLAPDESQPLVAVNLRVASGSRHDPPGLSGQAHVLEHLMFAGTRRHGRGGHHRAIQSAGGFVNAKTSADWTKYLHGVTPDLIDLVLRLETERFSETAALIAEADVRLECGVVGNERAQRMRGVPYGDAIEQLVSLLYLPSSGYHRLPIGLPPELATISLDDCRKFHADSYVGPRVNLSIVGRFQPDRVLDAVTGLLDVFDAGVAAGQPQHTEPVGGRRVIEGPARPKIYLGYLLAPEGTWEFELARLAGFLLGRGLSSFLADRLTRRAGVASSVAVKTMGRGYDRSVGMVEVIAAQGVSADQVIAAVDGAIRLAAQGTFTDRDIYRAVALYRAGRLADDDSFMTRADGYSLAMQLSGNASRHMEHDPAVFAASRAELHAGLNMWDQPSRRAEVIYTR